MQAPSVAISVLIPILNEVNHLDSLLSSLMDMDNPGQCEFFLIDGGSTDGTHEKIALWQQQYSFIYRVDNVQRYANFGFNNAFPLTKGRYIAFLGAHAEYPPKFLSIGKQYLDDNKCDAVGGPLIQKAKSAKGLGIAHAMSSKLGVGDTAFRTSSDMRYVDSVAFAMYKREVFEKIGLLDEELIRNQDDEFHYRMNSTGYKILMVPEMACVYYVRETLRSLFKQYFQYGLFKPLVLKKVRAGMRVRHLIPACFVLYLLWLPVSFVFLGIASTIPLAIYAVLVFYVSSVKKLSLQSKVISCLAFPTLHISYGIGFLVGLRKIL